MLHVVYHCSCAQVQSPSATFGSKPGHPMHDGSERLGTRTLAPDPTLQPPAAGPIVREPWRPGSRSPPQRSREARHCVGRAVAHAIGAAAKASCRKTCPRVPRGSPMGGMRLECMAAAPLLDHPIAVASVDRKKLRRTKSRQPSPMRSSTGASVGRAGIGFDRQAGPQRHTCALCDGDEGGTLRRAAVDGTRRRPRHSR